jgi:hypothetical protein
MNSRDYSHRPLRIPAPLFALASLLGVGMLGGCAQDAWREMRGDFGPVQLAPGITRACYVDPCAVVYTLPAGTGSYSVRANDVVLGSFPAGEPASLGAFSKQDSPVTITVDGMDRSAAVLFVFEPYSY